MNEDIEYVLTELRAGAAGLREVRAQAEVFVSDNNDWEGFAPRYAKRLRALLGEG